MHDHQYPGHWEGDLIWGESYASAASPLVKSISRLLMLVVLLLPKSARAANLLHAFTDKLCSNAEYIRRP